MGRKRKNNEKPKVHPELEGLDLNINEFGELISNIDMDKINEFLTKNVPDKKLMNRYDDAYQQDFKAAEDAAKAAAEDDDEDNYVEEGEPEEDDTFENIKDEDVEMDDREDDDEGDED